MRFALAALVLVGSTATHSSAQSAPRAIFRELTVAPVGRVALGEPLVEADRFTRINEMLHEVKPADGDVSSIMVAVDSNGVVRAVAITYRPGRDYAAARAAYIQKLGAPKEIDEVEEGTVIKGAQWEDAGTWFAIAQRQYADSLPDVVEILRDRDPRESVHPGR